MSDFSFALFADPGRSAVGGERKVVMPRSLPVNPSVRFLQLEAKDIVKAHKNGDLTCCATLRYHFRFSRADDDEILKAQVTLQEAQHALSLDYGFKSWTDLIKRARALSDADQPADGNVSARRRKANGQARISESIGTLAGGIAHEFSNSLEGIAGNIELLKTNIPLEGKLSEFVEPIALASQRMINLTRQLLAFAGGGRRNLKSIAPSAFLNDILPILKEEMKPAIRLETNFTEDVPRVTMDLTQIQMVLSAVLRNASEAMDDDGLVKMSIGSVVIDDDDIEADPGLKLGQYACFRIEDNGKGMDEETRNRIFDPFFSTKFQGRGLGMAAVFGIINNHGGMISVDSELNEGTVVRILLPAG